jgi:hypothetical protein
MSTPWWMPQIHITSETVKATPKMLKANWSLKAAQDLKALWRDHKKWIEKVSKPDYVFTEADIPYFEDLGYPGITVEELQSGAIPPEITENRIAPEKDSEAG